jgi:asparagine synthase (glutamine-hydrolysing)
LLHRKKRGFAVNVVDDWFRASIKSQFQDTFMDSSSEIYKFLRPAAVEQLLSSHRSGQRDHHKLLFSLVVCENLLRLSRSQSPSETVPVGAGRGGV